MGRYSVTYSGMSIDIIYIYIYLYYIYIAGGLWGLSTPLHAMASQTTMHETNLAISNI